MLTINDTRYARVQPSHHDEEPSKDDQAPKHRLHLLPLGAPVLGARREVEPEEAGDAVREPAGEERADDTEEVVEERDDLRDDEREDPDRDADADPGRPARDGV